MGLKFTRCLSPANDCTDPPINAHSVQNARYLEKLSRKGHVISLTRRIRDGVPTVDFVSRGKNEATTFTGLCSRHDTEIFHPIESEAIDFRNPKHLFLLAYRAVLKETHATGQSAIQVQTAYTDRVAAGLDPKNEPSPLGVFATQRLILAYETYMYKTEFDELFLNGRHEKIEHDMVQLNHRRPSVAASCLFSLDHLVRGDDVVRVALTVLPCEGSGSIGLFSYLEKDSATARLALSRVLEAVGEHQQYELSRLMLNYCENFVVSPFVFDAWADEKKENIREFFTRTIFESDMSFEDKTLVLFD